MSPFAITAKPWFCTVTSTRPVSTSRTGWFAPRWPNGSLKVLWPSASPSSWWPRQTPNSGTRPSSCADRLDLVDEHRRVAGAVADQHRRAGRPRGSRRRPTSPGTTYASTPASREPVRDRALHAEVDDDDARARADRVRLLRPRLARQRVAVDERLGERALAQLLDRRVAERAAQHAAVADLAHERARVDRRSSATTPRSRSQAANSGRASRITTPSHCTRSDSIRASSTPYVPISGYEKQSTCAT